MRLRRSEQEEFFSQVPLFANLSKADLREVAKRSTEISMGAGRALIREGQVGHEMFIVVDGTVVVRRGGRKLASRGPGAVLGEMALLDREPRSASVFTETEVTLLVLSSREFSELVDAVPGFSRKLLRALSLRLRESEKRLL